jgi:hypothetical protein
MLGGAVGRAACAAARARRRCRISPPCCRGCSSAPGGARRDRRLFLVFTALLWTIAGVHARAYVSAGPDRYFFFHLLALTGNLGLIVAQDLATFYCSSR